MNKTLPRPTAVSAPYWQACHEGELRLQRCLDCNHTQFYPRLFCTECQGDSLEWLRAEGTGTIASFTVVRRGVSEAYPAPYIVALIDLTEGPRMMSHVVDVDPEAVAVGHRVAVHFAAWSQDIVMPVFTLDPAANQGGDNQ
jgi:uncharacterized OB-fold protein